LKGELVGEKELVVVELDSVCWKSYTFTTTEALTCDILVVAGGGGGGNERGAGGGGGGVLYSQNIILYGTYTIMVGEQGKGTTSGLGGAGTRGINGMYSSINGSSLTTITVIGGGGGGSCGPGDIRNGLPGGSGGGGSHQERFRFDNLPSS
jgi:hypothetical protein